MSTVAACVALVLAAGAFAAETPAGYSRVLVAPAKTSIYVGSVSMTMPPFERVADGFESTYVAKVFPYFFYNESGRLRVEMSDESLRRLRSGETVLFTGRAVNEDGAERRVEGKATPSTARAGTLKVRVFYSRRIELIFNTTYRFPDVLPAVVETADHFSAGLVQKNSRESRE